MGSSFTGLFFALLSAGFLAAFSAYQVTNAMSGPRLLGRLAASLVELERWVPSHSEDIQLLARDRPQESVLVDELPVDVVLPSPGVLAANETELTTQLRDAMGARLYTEGRGVLQDEAGRSHLGITDPVRWTVSMLSSGAHTFWRLVSIITGLLALALLVGMLISRWSPLPWVLGGAIAAVVLSFFVWLIGGVAGSLVESSVDQEITMILRDAGWLALRNSLAASVIALALLYLWRTLLSPAQRNEELYWPEVSEPLDETSPDAS